MFAFLASTWAGCRRFFLRQLRQRVATPLVAVLSAIAMQPHIAPVFADASTAPPNVILILTDDQGYYDLGCYGGTEFATPRLDALAETGIRFTDYYAAAPICSPSRAGLLTGCYPRRVGMETWVLRADSPNGIHPAELTMAELFHGRHFTTGCIGKWHLGDEDPFRPLAQGFDHYFGLMHNLDPPEIVFFEDGAVPIIRNDEIVEPRADPAKLTKAYTDEAIAFIETNADRPFFLYLPHTMAHNPLGVSKEFSGTTQMGEYGDVIAELDHNVGRLVDRVKELDLWERTVIVYLSDNGRGPGRNDAQPIQGRKLSTYEGGIRVPAIVAGGPIRSGHVSRELVHAMDWYPSLASLADIRIPDGPVIDGRDLSPILTGASDTVAASSKVKTRNRQITQRRPWNPQREWADIVSREEYTNAFFYHGSQGALAAVRSGKWKLVLNRSLELYDLEADPGETTLVRKERDVIRKLRAMAVMFQDEMRRDARPGGDQWRPAESYQLKSTTTESGLTAWENVTYARYGDREMQLDVYAPNDVANGDLDEPLPAVLCVHGGGWANGHRAGFRRIAQALAEQGFVAATASYRLSGEAPFPAAIQDVKAAVRYLRANAAEYQLDPNRIGAMGHSAGGHLVALLATSGGIEEFDATGDFRHVSSRVQAAVPMGARTDLMSAHNGEITRSENGAIWRQFLRGSQDRSPEVYQAASPFTHLTADDPPMKFLTGELDDPVTRAEFFRGRASELGVTTDVRVFLGGGHGFFNTKETFDEVIEEVATFLNEAMK